MDSLDNHNGMKEAKFSACRKCVQNDFAKKYPLLDTEMTSDNIKISTEGNYSCSTRLLGTLIFKPRVASSYDCFSAKAKKEYFRRIERESYHERDKAQCNKTMITKSRAIKLCLFFLR